MLRRSRCFAKRDLPVALFRRNRVPQVETHDNRSSVIHLFIKITLPEILVPNCVFAFYRDHDRLLPALVTCTHVVCPDNSNWRFLKKINSLYSPNFKFSPPRLGDLSAVGLWLWGLRKSRYPFLLWVIYSLLGMYSMDEGWVS